MSKKWFDTGYIKSKPQGVDREAGIVGGVKVCSEGEAKGHGVSLDSEFIDTLVLQGNDRKQGLKARFGHPNMCSTALGTFIGRFSNFRRGSTTRDDGSQAACCFADLALSESAKETPNGDLHSYILSLAENEADMFGTSIVFTPGQVYHRKANGEKVYPYDERGKYNEEYDKAGGPQYVECDQLHACDCVDEPAANDGLFSAFANENIAGQITEFLDLNPQVFQVLENNPEVMDAIAKYGDRMDEFLERYRVYRSNASDNPKKEAEMSDKTKDKDLKVDEKPEGVQPKAEGLKVEELKEKAEPKAADVDAAVQQALKDERTRTAAITELGSKFNFAADAMKFIAEGKSVEEFRTHILGKSPEDWRDSMKVQNPSLQDTEKDLGKAAGSAAVETIKERRQKKYGAK